MSDIDDFTSADPCGCGHRLASHRSGGPCTGTTRQIDRDALPTPAYDNPDDPFAWPNNWPPLPEVPYADKPCTCPAFAEPEPDIPEEYL